MTLPRIQDLPVNGKKKNGLPTAFSSFRHHNFRLWFGGQLVSVIGTWMQIIAQGWLVYQISHSEFALGLVGFMSAIPVLLVSPWGGVVIDRVPRRTLLIITQSSSMALAFILSLLTFLGVVQVWHVLVLATLLGVINAFDAPARQAFVIDMVGREDLVNAIALNSVIFNGARVIGPALGGLLLAAFGAAWCFFFNGLSFLAVIVALTAMQFSTITRPKSVLNPFRQFTEGLQYARNHKDILSLLVLAAIFSVFGLAYTAIMPAFVDQVLHGGETGYGAINAFIGVGAVSAAALLAQLSSSGRRGLMLTIADLVFPFALVLFAINTSMPVAFVLSVVLGFGFMMLLTNVNSLLQLNVEDEKRGRVMALYTLSFFGLSPFGSLAIGSLGQVLPLPTTLMISAAIMLVLSVVVFLKAPEVPKM